MTVLKAGERRPAGAMCPTARRGDGDNELVAELLRSLQIARSQRSVDVRFVLDDSVNSSVVAELEALGFPVHLCPTNCVGGSHGIQPNKFVVFSSIGGTNVVVNTSANWEANALANQFEATLIVSEYDPATALVVDAHRERFVDFETGRPPEELAYRSVRNGNLTVTFFPQQEGDHFAEILRAIDLDRSRQPNAQCSHSNKRGEEQTTVIRVAVSAADGQRPEVVESLLDLYRAGCVVQVFAFSGAMQLLRQLIWNGFPVHMAAGGDRGDSGAWCIARQHAKELTVRGRFDGAPAKTAWLGSHNPALTNLRNASDTWLRVDENATFRALNKHMDMMFDEAVRCP